MSKDAYYFSHDTNARHDPKISALKADYGIEGYGRFWIIVELLAEQKDYKLKHNSWGIRAVATECQCDTEEIKQFIEDCVEEFELFESDGEYFWSESLNERMKKKDKIIEQKRRAGKKGAEARWSNNSNKAKGKQCDSSAIGTVIANDGKLNEIKLKEIKKTKLKKIINNSTVAERKILKILNNIKNYPIDIERDIEFIREKQEQFPKVNFVEEIKKWKTWLLDNPLKKNSNPRLQMTNWFDNASTGKYSNNNSRKVADF